MGRMMSKQDVYVDWSKAPQGTTHAYVDNISVWCGGVPKNRYWEKWQDGDIFEWTGDGWNYYTNQLSVCEQHRIKKPEGKVMNTNSLQQNIERMEKELAEMKAKLKAGEKWEPKGGDWFVDFNGKVKNYRGIDLECSWFGTSFQTQQQAEIASKLMRERNRIVQYVLEHEPGCKFEFDKGVDNHYVCYDHSDKTWIVLCSQNVESLHIHMPEWVAEKLADDLNSGRVEL